MELMQMISTGSPRLFNGEVLKFWGEVFESKPKTVFKNRKWGSVAVG